MLSQIHIKNPGTSRCALSRAKLSLLAFFFILFFCVAKDAMGQTPEITGIGPNPVVTGQQLTITGTNFGGTNGYVIFGNLTQAGGVSSWNPTQIVITVPAAAQSGLVSVENSEGAISNSMSLTVGNPTISSISPTTVVVGQQLTITGTSFGSTNGYVIFGNLTQAGGVSSWTDSQIVITVPAAAQTGPLSVENAGGAKSNSMSLTVGNPTISSISPTTVVTGQPLTITGTNFGSTNGYVIFGNLTQAGGVSSWNDSRIVITVPSAAQTGPLSVESAEGAKSNSMSLTVGNPTISSISPTTVVVGQPLTITGTNFGSTNGYVIFGNLTQAGGVSSWTDSQIVITVPAAAQSGQLSIENAGGAKSNSMSLTVGNPTITSISPTTVVVGQPLTITGTNFGSTNGYVIFGNLTQAGGVISWNPTQIVITVPAAAQTGQLQVSVENSQGAQSNSVSLTVGSPTISSISPTTVAPGQPLTITGTNFGSTSAYVIFGNLTQAGGISSWTSTQIVITVPAAAQTGLLSIENAGGARSNSVNLTVTDGGFVDTGSLNTARVGHTATLLNNGMVLMAGGHDVNGNSLSSAELYNPAAGTFTPTGGLNAGRWGHTATLLNNGMVLLAGGVGSSDFAITSAELYNPATGTFTPTGSLNNARASHTATLLNNGMVLMAGGGTELASAELYDPTSGTFIPTGSMNTVRFRQTATLLNNGMVLMAGGQSSSFYALASAELYNPATGIFTYTTRSLNTARYGHTATLLNDGLVVMAGGANASGTPLDNAELYNPATGSFTPTGNLQAARSFHTATLLNNGTLLIAGGMGLVSTLASAELYDPAAGTFTPTGSLNTARYGHTATLLNNGIVLVAGGLDQSYCLASAELYQPATLTPPNLVSIALSPSSPTVPLDTEQRLIATGTFSDNSTEQLASVIWSTSNASAVSISNDASNPGTAYAALAAGSATVSACTGAVCGSTLVTVGPPALVSIAVTPANMYVAPGSTVQFSATGTYSDGGTQGLTTLVTWTSSAPGVATITSGGLATGVTMGTSSISATMGGISGSTTLTVNVLVSMAVTPANPSITVGATQQFTATGTYSDGSTQNLTATAVWSSSAAGVATISNTSGSQGLATAAGVGMTTIEAAAGAINGSTTLTITAAPTFVYTGNLTTALGLQTATRLNNGMVLMAGGATSPTGDVATEELYNPATGTFTPTGSLNMARTYHTATLLNNGMVLIAGGQGSNGYLASAELYNPTTGTFTPTGSMNTARFDQTATLLNSGTILMAGGYGLIGGVSYDFLASAELYNPATGSFTPTGSLNNARMYHTATLLNNGMVMIAGGTGADGYVASAELYDSTSGTFTPTGSLNAVRNFDTATLLNNGMVLIAGGDGSNGYLASAELYDPATQNFTLTSSLNAEREDHTATLLNNGMVLMAGGVNSSGYLTSAELYEPATLTPPGLVSISVSPAAPTVPLDTTQRMIATGTFGDTSTEQLASVTWSTSNASAVSVTNDASNSGAAYAALAAGSATVSACAGAVCGSTTVTVGPPALVSIAVTPANSYVGPGLTLQFSATGTYSDGSTQVLTSSVTWTSSVPGVATISAGGLASGLITGSTTITAAWGGVQGTTTLWVGPPVLVSMAVAPANPSIGVGTTQQFTATGTYSDGRMQNLTNTVVWSSSALGVATISNASGSQGLASAASVGTTTIAAAVGAISGSTALTVTAGFLLTGSLNTARAYHTATLLTSGMVLIAGGQDLNNYLASAELYNPATGSFTPTGSLNTARAYHTATLLDNGMVLMTGGLGSSGSLASAELYNPATGTFTPTGSLNTARASHTATLLNNGMVLMAGGFGSSGSLASAELYNPATGTFTPTGNLDTARASHTATLLNNGTVLMAGGLGSAGVDAYYCLTYAELYNPTTGTFTPTGSLNTARYGHTATLLNYGLVLIAGGYNYSTGYLADTEEYDFGSGTFAPAGSLNTGRVNQTATLLSNGTVLFAGGRNSSGFLASAELYDPDGGTSTATASLNAARCSHTATLLADGMVLMAGGIGITGAELGSAELYAPLMLPPPLLQSISVSPAAPTVPLGTAQLLIATGFFDHFTPLGQLASVTWSSSNPAAVSITDDASNSGAAYAALAAGSATVSACAGAVCGSTLVTVGPPALVSIAVTPGNGTAPAGLSVQFSAMGTYSDGSTLDLTSSANWVSSALDVATISAGGLASGLIIGSTAITAGLSGVQGTTVLTVTAAPTGTLVSIAVTPANSSIVGGGTQQFTATGTYSDGSTQNLTDVVAWRSSAQRLATIKSGGLASTRGAGTSSISATLGSISGSTTLTMIALVSMAVTPANPSIVVGGTQQFTATGTYSDGSMQNLNGAVVWTSSASSVATISNTLGSQGLAMAFQAGTTTIEAASGAINGSTTLTALNPSPGVSSISPASAAAGRAGFTLTVSGANFLPTSTIQWNGSTLPTTFIDNVELTATVPATDIQSLGNNSVTVFNPTPGGGLSAAATFTTYLALPANDLVYNPSTQLLYASVPSAGGPTLGNSIVSIDPYTGVLGSPIWVGSEPGKMALSSDGSTIWAGLNGAGAVRQVNLNTQTAGLQFNLGGGTGEYNPPNTAQALAVMPGYPNTVAIADSTSQAYTSLVTIYDSGVPRPNSLNGAVQCCSGVTGMAFDPTGTYLYEAGSGYGVATVNSTGIASATSLNSSVSTSALDVDNGQAYLTDGVVLNASAGVQVGVFSIPQNQVLNGPVASDSALGEGFLLYNPNYGSAYQINTYALSTFDLLGMIPVGGVTYSAPSPSVLRRWGPNGLAFTTGTQVYILTSPLVQNLSSSLADLSVTANAPAAGPTGTNLTYTLTVSNAGPLTATPATVIDTLPGSVTLQSVTPSQGNCSSGAVISCDLGNLNSGSSATIQIIITPLTAGTLTNTAVVSAPEGDPNLANNTAVSTTAVTGVVYTPSPAITSISPAFVQAGASSFTLTVNGSGFASSSTVQLNSTALPTTFVSSTQLTATVAGSDVASMGWAWINITNPAPGGGTSSNLPLTTYSVVSLDINRMAFDPYTRKLYATVPSTATQVTGNSLVAIDPTTGALGTPLNIGSGPNRIAESSDGQYLFIGLDGAKSLTNFNLTTATQGPVYPLTISYFGTPTQVAARDLAVVPGDDNLLAIDTGEDYGLGLLDISGSTATMRPNLTGEYTGSWLSFANSTTLYSYDSDTSDFEIRIWTVGSSGLTLNDNTGYTLDGMGGYYGAYQLFDGLVYGFGGGVANPATTPPTQLGQFEFSSAQVNGQVNEGSGVSANPSYGRVFYLGVTGEGEAISALLSYDSNRYVLVGAQEFTGTAEGQDLVRWGRDGLAWHSSMSALFGDSTPGSGQLFLMRGPFVLPEWSTVNATPTLSSASPASVSAGSGNFILTVTGSGFVPGAVLKWNGAERTTTFVNTSQLTVAIPAADVSEAGTATLVVNNPGSSDSNSVSFTIN